jgi:3-hydroxyacyl-CoA dehydrogenase/3-hydroxy-2-methylbutyryl-CoA dehydrogenase
MQVRDSVVLVTGGASGLGEAVVRQALASGARGVAIMDMSADQGENLAAEFGDRAIFARTDVRETEQVAAAIAQAVATFGQIDAVVCCAGIAIAERTVARDGSPADLSHYSNLIAVNLIGTFDVVRQVAAAMSTNPLNGDGERGVIIMTASVAAFDGQIGQVAYAASKGGLVAMTLPLARDLAPSAIRVMTIAPGLINTPIYAFAPPELLVTLAESPVFPKRLGHPEEFARLAVSIMENTYLNGEVIRLDAAIRMPPK